MIGVRCVMSRLTTLGTEQLNVRRFFLGGRIPAGALTDHDYALRNATV